MSFYHIWFSQSRRDIADFERYLHDVRFSQLECFSGTIFLVGGVGTVICSLLEILYLNKAIPDSAIKTLSSENISYGFLLISLGLLATSFHAAGLIFFDQYYPRQSSAKFYTPYFQLSIGTNLFEALVFTLHSDLTPTTDQGFAISGLILAFSLANAMASAITLYWRNSILGIDFYTGLGNLLDLSCYPPRAPVEFNDNRQAVIIEIAPRVAERAVATRPEIYPQPRGRSDSVASNGSAFRI